MNKVELLAPAGSLEKLKMAILYGADAVYLAGESFGLRTASDNFNLDEMKEGVSFAHERGKKVYLAMNIFAHNQQIDEAGQFIQSAYQTGIDAVIVSDPGMFAVIRETAPDLPVHISTQANNTNYKSIEFWRKLGASRVVLARELSLREISQIHAEVSPELELECFIHGSMCMSYSGRCLLSNYLVGRDANQGDCAHPCRWKYRLLEEKRPGQYYPIEEDDHGTYVFNSKDLCMIRYIPELIVSGIKSFKIEGRVKSSFYVATVIKAYREAIDAYYSAPQSYAFKEEWFEEVSKVSNRDFTTGFFFGKPTEEDHNYGTNSYIRGYEYIGIVKDYDEENNFLIVEQRNRFFSGDRIEIIQPTGSFEELVIDELFDADGNRIESAPHPQMTVKIRCNRRYPSHSILRKSA